MANVQQKFSNSTNIDDIMMSKLSLDLDFASSDATTIEKSGSNDQDQDQDLNLTLGMLEELLHAPPSSPGNNESGTSGLSNAKMTPDGTQIDWTQYDHVVLYHTRKAGGSSLYVWAKRVAQKHNLTISQQEGTCYDPSGWQNKPRVLVFTSLRPPVDRIISSYEYDGLQSAKKKMGANYTLSLQTFVDLANDANDGRDGRRNQRNVWRSTGAQMPQQNKKKATRNNRGRKKPQTRRSSTDVQVMQGWVWRCATQCYSKWFGGWPQPDLVPDTKTAVQRLDDLEIVWMNNYQNPAYMKWFLHRWDAEDIPMVHKRKTKPHTKQNYTHDELNLLHSSNRKDELLYEALRTKWSRFTEISLL